MEWYAFYAVVGAGTLLVGTGVVLGRNGLRWAGTSLAVGALCITGAAIWYLRPLLDQLELPRSIAELRHLLDEKGRAHLRDAQKLAEAESALAQARATIDEQRQKLDKLTDDLRAVEKAAATVAIRLDPLGNDIEELSRSVSGVATKAEDVSTSVAEIRKQSSELSKRQLDAADEVKSQLTSISERTEGLLEKHGKSEKKQSDLAAEVAENFALISEEAKAFSKRLDRLDEKQAAILQRLSSPSDSPNQNAGCSDAPEVLGIYAANALIALDLAEMVRGYRGKYYLIDFENDVPGGALAYELHGLRPRDGSRLTRFLDLLGKILEKAPRLSGCVRLFVRGSADKSGKAWERDIPSDHILPPFIEYHASEGDRIYGSRKSRKAIGPKYSNGDLPFIRAQELGTRMREALRLAGDRLHILEGEVLPVVDPKGRAAQAWLFIQSQ